MRVLGWMVIYKGNYIADSRTHRWEDLPDDGLLDGCVYRLRDDGQCTRRTIGGSDHYWLLEDGCTIAHSNDSKADILERYPNAVVKRGIWVPDDEMAEAAKLTLEYKWR